jgi:hypothetical protein
MTGEIDFEEKQQPIQTKPVQPPSTGGIVSVLEARLEMYKKAVQTAKASGESTKARRYERQYNVKILFDRRKHSIFLFRLSKNYCKQLVLVNQLMKVKFHLLLVLVLLLLFLRLNQKWFHNQYLLELLLLRHLLHLYKKLIHQSFLNVNSSIEI